MEKKFNTHFYNHVRCRRVVSLILPVCVMFVMFFYQKEMMRFLRTRKTLTGTWVETGSKYEGYLIRTEGCTLQDYDPWDERIKKYVGKFLQIDCNPKNLSALSTASQESIGITNDTAALLKYGLTAETMFCCYQEVTRIQESLDKYTKKCDKKYSLGPCQPITASEVAPITAEGALVICNNTKSGEAVYKKVHYFFPSKKVQAKLDKFKSQYNSSGEARPLNFFMIGIDSLARQSLRRLMPKTFELFSNNSATIDFRIYNKVGENTDPNLSALLTGYDPELFLNYKYHCYKKRWQSFDNCTFLWDQFSQKGYVTAYAEDLPKIGLFHYNRLGHVKPPTDYYNRPFFLLSDAVLEFLPKRVNMCKGLELSSQIVLNTADKVMEKYLNEISLFGFFYTTAFTHDNPTGGAMLDEPHLNFFRKFIEKGYNNNSIVLFYSDHGMRFGKLRATHLGGIEERMPFMMFMFPPWFKDTYPETWKNLQINTGRLVNNYDVYLTIQDIIADSYVKSSNPRTDSGFGQSLFLEVPESRSCKSSGIPEHFCSCQSSKEVSVEDKEVIEAAEYFIKHINDIIIHAQPQCAKLKLDQVIDAQVSSLQLKLEKVNNTVQVSNTGQWKTYTLILQTTPGFGQFEATVMRENTNWRISAQFSRVNMYANQSNCVEDSILKLVCYCIPATH